MSKTILQKYLTLQFIPTDDIVGVEKLNKSAEVLAKKLKKEKHRIASFTLVALDPNIVPSDSIVTEVQTIITEKWPVFVNKAGGNHLVTYVRAVILQAISDLCEESIEISGIVWLTGSNVWPYYNLGREKEVLQEWLKNIRINYETEARKTWAVSGLKLSGKVPEPSEVDLKIKSYTMNSEDLKEKLRAAAGPQKINDGGAQEGTNGNRYWPHQNPQHWVGDFGKFASESISTAVNDTFKANNKELTSYITNANSQLKEYTKSLKPYLEGLGQTLLNRSNSVDLRSQLLWLKESQYSNTLAGSYRELDSDSLAFFIANDLSEFLPGLYPGSIDYFVKEVGRVSNEKMDEPVSITELIVNAAKNPALKEFITLSKELSGRISLFAFVALHLKGAKQISQLKESTGLPLEIKISRSELCTWMLRDMQALKLSN